MEETGRPMRPVPRPTHRLPPPLVLMPRYRGYRTDSIRLDGWDYRTSAWYFLTLCTHRRVCHFGTVRGGIVGLSPAGCVAAQEWVRTAVVRPYVRLDAWIVMPNHVHGLVGITTASPGHRAATADDDDNSSDDDDGGVETSRRDVFYGDGGTGCTVDGAFNRGHHGAIQIRVHAADSGNGRRGVCVATTLLRPHRAQPARLRCRPSVHPRQPCALGGGHPPSGADGSAMSRLPTPPRPQPVPRPGAAGWRGE